MTNGKNPNIRPAIIPVVRAFAIAGSIAFGISIIFYLFEGQNMYILSFGDGSAIYSQDGIVLSADGTIIQIYKINDDTGYISSAQFISEEGKKISGSQIKFNDTTEFNLHDEFIRSPKPYPVDLSISTFERGMFHGWFLLTNLQKTSSIYIPSIISSEPYLLAPIFLIITGVCVSVCIWEIFRYLRAGPPKVKKYLDKIKKLNGKSSNVLTEAAALGNPVNNVQSLTNKLGDNVADLSMAYIFRSAQPITKKITYLEVIPTLIGIAFGLFATFKDAVPSLLILDAYQGIILFGIGLGAGSRKELVDKDP
jgi:hypothetical protein